MADFDDAFVVHETGEEYAILRASSCACGGSWLVGRQQLLYHESQGKHYDVLTASCVSCGTERQFVFDISSFFPRSELLRENIDVAGEVAPSRRRTNGRGDTLMIIGVLLGLFGVLFLISGDVALVMALVVLGLVFVAAGWRRGRPETPSTI